MRSAIARITEITEVDITVEDRFVRMKFPAERIDLQRILTTIAGKNNRFQGRLVLQLEDRKTSPADFERLRAALMSTKGVRQVSQPDESGIVLLTMIDKEKTLLTDILRAAKQAGIALIDPERKKPGSK